MSSLRWRCRDAVGNGVAGGRERAARQRVETLQAELREAEAVWERFVIARETVGEVLAEPRGGKEVPPVVMAGRRPVKVTAAVPGSVVPHWQEGLGPDGSGAGLPADHGRPGRWERGA